MRALFDKHDHAAHRSDLEHKTAVSRGVEPCEPKRGTQRAKVLEALKDGPKTSVELNLICYRYSARIHELRKHGHKIIGTPSGGLFTYELETP